MQKEETKMWSYKMTHDAMMAPNPLFGILTLATCKPRIRKSPNTKPGVWIAGWTACTIHNSELAESKISRCAMGEEKLIYLAKVTDVIPLDEYWVKYQQKRPVENVEVHNAYFYGDNYYYKENGMDMTAPNNQHKYDWEERDRSGKNAIICEEFYYFTPENRLDVGKYNSLIHKGIGQAMKKGQLVDEFIGYVRACANELGVKDGIIGSLDINYDKPKEIREINVKGRSCCGKKKGGCGK